jgi:DNA-directed RNA polymerase specialized sigma subunit
MSESNRPWGDTPKTLDEYRHQASERKRKRLEYYAKKRLELVPKKKGRRPVRTANEMEDHRQQIRKLYKQEEPRFSIKEIAAVVDLSESAVHSCIKDGNFGDRRSSYAGRN